MDKTILVVDDSSFMRHTIRQVLLSMGYKNIIEASTGVFALELYKKKKPCLTILDIIMPEVDGLTVLAEIMAFDQKAKVIMCSELNQEGIISKGLSLGAVDFIIKPFSVEDFVKRVARQLKLP